MSGVLITVKAGRSLSETEAWNRLNALITSLEPFPGSTYSNDVLEKFVNDAWKIVEEATKNRIPGDKHPSELARSMTDTIVTAIKSYIDTFGEPEWAQLVKLDRSNYETMQAIVERIFASLSAPDDSFLDLAMDREPRRRTP